MSDKETIKAIRDALLAAKLAERGSPERAAALNRVNDLGKAAIESIPDRHQRQQFTRSLGAEMGEARNA
ncbi:hypothetical protein GCM10010174_80750 [Kutzneria viridogrisea]|uniref:Uncharacterized protein n=1 Tax=Kutzneria viridogrisea TaxID=47990 RepID=A0ABR6BYZ6_9PSEU|nr:hypothetical protein [Kutzneria viridogrisea]